ncbi:MAG UNVERIFIED_CONTAM: ABC transporter permease [Planctomycetaceae bacterium]
MDSAASPEQVPRMIPAKYNLRNLRVRWMTTLMTVISTGLVVWASVLCFGLTDGLRYALQVTGHELDLIVLRKGSTDEISSGLEQKVASDVASLPGIAKDANGRPLCSVEFVTILTKPRRNNGGIVNLIVRGLDDTGRTLRPDFRIVEGRDVKPGTFEAITSRTMAARFENLGIGEELEINRRNFRIVGYFEAAGSALPNPKSGPTSVTSPSLANPPAPSAPSAFAQISRTTRSTHRDTRGRQTLPTVRSPRNSVLRGSDESGQCHPVHRIRHRRLPDLRSDVRGRQYHVCSRRQPRPRNRHPASTRISSLRNPLLLPFRSHRPLPARRSSRLRRHTALQWPVHRHRQSVQRNHVFVPLRPPSAPAGRYSGPRHGTSRRHPPRRPRRSTEHHHRTAGTLITKSLRRPTLRHPLNTRQQRNAHKRDEAQRNGQDPGWLNGTIAVAASSPYTRE